jgi:hypothetical protein
MFSVCYTNDKDVSSWLPEAMSIGFSLLGN